MTRAKRTNSPPAPESRAPAGARDLGGSAAASALAAAEALAAALPLDLLGGQTPPRMLHAEPSSPRFGLVDYERIIRYYADDPALLVEASVSALSEEMADSCEPFLAVEDFTFLRGPDDVPRQTLLHFLLLTADRRLVDVEVRRFAGAPAL